MDERSHNEMVSPNDAALLPIKFTNDTVGGFVKHLKEELGVNESSQLPKIEQELIFFSWFALDYWMSKSFSKEKSQAIRDALTIHLQNLTADSQDGENMVNTINERLEAYAQIVNEEMEDSAKFFRLGYKLAEFCDLQHPFLWMTAPEIFTSVLKYVSILVSKVST